MNISKQLMDKDNQELTNLKQAQQGLEFDNIFQTKTQAYLAEGFEPKYALSIGE